MALGAYYYTDDLPRYRDIVLEDLLRRIVYDKVFASTPKEFIAKVFRKHFPQCEAYPAGNMAQRDIPRPASGRVILPGEEFQVNTKVLPKIARLLSIRLHLGVSLGD